mgnify:CR=1 FL=1
MPTAKGEGDEDTVNEGLETLARLLPFLVVAAATRIGRKYGLLPLSFEANRGQADGRDLR